MKQTKTLGALALALLLALPGCQRTPADSTAPQQTTAPASGLAETVPTDPNHVYEQVQENLLIDAEIIAPPDGVTPKVYVGEMKTFTKEEIDAFLAWNGDGIAEVTRDDTQDKGHAYAGNCQSGSTFALEYSLNNLYPSIFSYVNYDLNKRYSCYQIYTTQFMYEQDTSLYIADLFAEPVDLSFATAVEAETQVREGLATLNLGELKLNRTLYISHDRMAQAGEILQGDEWSYEFKGTTVTYPQWDDWDEGDDCYMFEFFSAADGVPMTYRDWSSSAVSYSPNSIVVWYTKDGIIELNILHPWIFGQVAESPESIISAGEALAVAKAKYANIISSQNRIIESVNLAYVYRQDGGGWLLRPVWEVKIRLKATDTVPFDTFQYVGVDAITGEEL